MSVFKDLSPKFKSKKRRWPFGRQQSQQPTVRPVLSTQLTQQQTQKILTQAQTQARQIILEAKKRALEIRTQAESNAERQQNRLVERQAELDKQSTHIATDLARIQTREQFLGQQKKLVADLEKSTLQIQANYYQKILERIDQSEESIKHLIQADLERRLATASSKLIQSYENRATEESASMIQDILTTAMPRGSNSYYAEYQPALVRIPHPRVYRDIRGTNNCNQDFLEKLAKVELVFDETKTIKINALDSVDRELVRQTLERLIKSRRINPSNIRRVYNKTKQEMEKLMFQAGEELCHAVGVFNLPEDIIHKLGKFKYRFSFGQNMIEHTLEETLIGISLAHELKVDSNIVRLGCLFHDIGKVIYDDEATHVETGVEYLKAYNMPQEVIDCVAQSHEDEPFTSIESMIVHVADGISGARPAARHNDHEFANRMAYLEETPLQYPGVKEAFAIQAGREVRVVVDPKKVSDSDIAQLAKELRDRIKAELTYPGSVTVNVIREVSTTINVESASKQSIQA